MIRKEYGYGPEGNRQYAPPSLIKSEKGIVRGRPDESRISTSHVERFNASLRTGMKRMTRLTIAFSRCRRNHKAALALWVGYYNFCRSYRSLEMPPAMKACVSRRPWSMRDLLEVAIGATA